MVREGGFRACDDLLSFVGEKDNEVGLLPFSGWFVKPAQGVEVIRELQDRVDVKPLGLELLQNGDADDLPDVDLIHRERGLVRAEHLGDFRVDEKFEIRAQRPLHATELLGRLAEKSITEGDDQLMRALAYRPRSRSGRHITFWVFQKPQGALQAIAATKRRGTNDGD